MQLLLSGLMIGLLACGGSAIQADETSETLTFAPWTKACLNGKEAGAKQVCFTGSDGRLKSGMPVIGVVVIEPEGLDKILRVTVPLDAQLAHGTRVIVDQNQPILGSFALCFSGGCMSDSVANPEVIELLKKGKEVTVQAINADGQIGSRVLPLSGFAAAHEGPPTDPKIFEEQQKKLEEEQKRRPMAKRLKLETQRPPPISPTPPISALLPPYLVVPSAGFSGK